MCMLQKKIMRFFWAPYKIDRADGSDKLGQWVTILNPVHNREE